MSAALWRSCSPPGARAEYGEKGEYRGMRPMFPGNLFGGPAFVQFGKNNADAVDGYVYALSSDHWDNGTELRLGRAHKSAVQQSYGWEFCDITGGGAPVWSGGLESSKPILSIEGHISLPEMVYIPTIKKYLLLTWGLHEDFHASAGAELTVLESDNVWGPFSLVYYEWNWYKREAGCYCPRIPLKWFDYEKLTGWLEFSGNWETQVPYYLPQVMPFRLIKKGKII